MYGALPVKLWNNINRKYTNSIHGAPVSQLDLWEIASRANTAYLRASCTRNRDCVDMDSLKRELAIFIELLARIGVLSSG